MANPSIDIKNVSFSINKSKSGKELCYTCSIQVNDLTYKTTKTTPTKIAPNVLLNFLIESAKKDVDEMIIKNMNQHRGAE
jgi:hypothetical protein